MGVIVIVQNPIVNCHKVAVQNTASSPLRSQRFSFLWRPGPAHEHGVKAIDFRTSVASQDRHESAVGPTLGLEVPCRRRGHPQARVPASSRKLHCAGNAALYENRAASIAKTERRKANKPAVHQKINYFFFLLFTSLSRPPACLTQNNTNDARSLHMEMMTVPRMIRLAVLTVTNPPFRRRL